VLRHKYDPVVRLMHARGVAIRTIEMQGTKLLLRAEAPSAEVKNAVWDEIKKVDPTYADLAADISVSAGAAAGQGGPAGGVPAPRVGEGLAGAPARGGDGDFAGQGQGRGVGSRAVRVRHPHLVAPGADAGEGQGGHQARGRPLRDRARGQKPSVRMEDLDRAG